MVSLVDIVPQKRSVTIAAGDLELRGLGLRQIAYLFLQFPSLRNVFTQNAPEVDVAELITQAPDAVGTIIAEAADQPEAAGAIADGSLLTPDEVLDCLTAVRDLTFPRGLNPLLERLAGFVALGPALGQSGGDQAMSAPREQSSLSPPVMIAAE
jgi:hypothetical protein